jgi:hypothetical protein
MTAILIALSRRDGLRRGIFRLLEREPQLFAALLGIHVGEPLRREFGARRLLRMGSRLFQPGG